MMRFLYRSICAIALIALIFGVASETSQARINVSGVIPASGCSTSGIISTDQLISTGFSQVRTVGPGDEAVAGAWALVDDWVPSTSVIGATNCPIGGDAFGTFVVALQLTPTIGSWQQADIQELKLVQDSNCNAQYEPGLDFTLQTRSGDQLQSEGSITFFNGAQAAIVTLTDSAPRAAVCGTSGIPIMVVVTIGNNPTSGSTFGLSMEALAGEVPTRGIISSNFSSSLNPQASSLRLNIIGGGSGGPPPPSPPPSGGGSLASYDNNGNCIMEDSEFFGLVDAWINSVASNNLFFLGVDAWIGQTNICVSAAGLGEVQALSLQNIILSQSGYASMTFRAQGARIHSTAVEIFGLNGQRIYADEGVGSALRWNMRNMSGEAVANGVYLYRVSVIDQHGLSLSSDVRKLVLFR